MDARIKEAEAFFFEAMFDGYVTGKKPEEILGLPGHKQFVFRKGSYMLLDRWCTNHGSNKSAGTTTIWRDNVPVWVMQYGGEYVERAIPLLKDALYLAYSNDQFIGGRGVRLFKYKEGDLVYTNEPKRNSFGSFSGMEQIRDSVTGESLGHHTYRGMSLE